MGTHVGFVEDQVFGTDVQVAASGHGMPGI